MAWHRVELNTDPDFKFFVFFSFAEEVEQNTDQYCRCFPLLLQRQIQIQIQILGFFVFCSFAAQVAPNTGLFFFIFTAQVEPPYRLLMLFSISIEVPVDSQTVSLVEQIKRK